MRPTASSRYISSMSDPMKFTPSLAHATAVLPRPVNGSITGSTRSSPCRRRHCSGSRGGKVAGCGRSRSRSLDGLVGNEPRVARGSGRPRRRLASARCSTRPGRGRRAPAGRAACVPPGVKWKTNSWQSFRKRGAVDRLVVSDREVARQPGGGAGGVAVDGDRLDPVDDVLQLQVRPRRLRHVERGPGIGGLGADVQEQRARPARTRAAAATQRPVHCEVLGPAAAGRRSVL